MHMIATDPDCSHKFIIGFHGSIRYCVHCGKAEPKLDREASSANMTFSDALRDVKNGAAIQRAGWNGKGLVVKAQFPDSNSKMNLPYLYIEYPNGDRCPWLASQTDIMSEDWRTVQ